MKFSPLRLYRSQGDFYVIDCSQYLQKSSERKLRRRKRKISPLERQELRKLTLISRRHTLVNLVKFSIFT